jgi:IMP dehydrogenase
LNFLLDPPFRTTEDVTLIPKLGILNVSSEATVHPIFFNAPMDTVAHPDLLEAMLYAGEQAIVDRQLHVRSPSAYKAFVLKHIGNPNLWFSCGLRDATDMFKRIIEIVQETDLTGDFNVLVDISHGHCLEALQTYRALRTALPNAKIMSGSICTAQAARDCYEAGCTHLRVGVGPGAMCSTRIQTGIGVPNLSAVHAVWNAVPEAYIVADGGIKNPGQVAKYLAAGAHGVMLGTRLASTWESNWWVELPVEQPKVYDPTNPPQRKFVKIHRGQASASYQQDYSTTGRSVEGIETQIHWQGEYVNTVLHEFYTGLRHSISYLGLRDLKDINPNNPYLEMIPITQNGYREGEPRG